MPRSQALTFAIRTRRLPPTARSPASALQVASARDVSTLAQTASTLCRRHVSLLKTTYLRSAFAPSPLHNAVWRRHISSFPSQARPRASFLYHSIHKDRSLPAVLRRFIQQQYLTTARKKKWRDTLRWQLRFHGYFWPIFILLCVIYEGYWQIQREHEYPTPVEWSFWARWEGRMAKGILAKFERRGWGSNYEWGVCGDYLLKLLARLEDPKRDGKGIREQETQDGEGVIFVDTIGKLGYDISGKSEVWKQGYWEALMGAARVAEHMDGLCKRKGAKLEDKLFRWENIPGPQNPRPVPAAWDKDGAHLNVPGFAEVESAMDSPESFYLRILTSKGFSNRQKLDAALACADWYQFKGMKETSGSMYDWALDIAVGGLPGGADRVVDMQTGVISAGQESFVTENLLKASTALGVWHARNGEVKEALPIFLSLLRARKALPAAPPEMQLRASGPPNQTQDRKDPIDTVFDFFGRFIDFFTEKDTTLVKSSGDERPFHSLREACEEIGLMTYIGEILFATSENEREKGLSWTRDSVEAAEAVLWFMDEQGLGRSEGGKQRCKECLETGLANWQQMTRQMAKLAKQKEDEAKQSTGWLGLGIGRRSTVDKAAAEVKKWQEEEGEIELRRQKVSSLIDPMRQPGNPFGGVTSNMSV